MNDFERGYMTALIDAFYIAFHEFGEDDVGRAITELRIPPGTEKTDQQLRDELK